jgi:hypothetical protein
MQKGSLRRRTCASLSLSAILLCAAWLLAQSSPEQLPAPTIRVNTRLVLVDVVVTDRQGKPVMGLKAEDFTIEEKGKKQKVAFFSGTNLQGGCLSTNSAAGNSAEVGFGCEDG